MLCRSVDICWVRYSWNSCFALSSSPSSSWSLWPALKTYTQPLCGWSLSSIKREPVFHEAVIFTSLGCRCRLPTVAFLNTPLARLLTPPQQTHQHDSFQLPPLWGRIPFYLAFPVMFHGLLWSGPWLSFWLFLSVGNISDCSGKFKSCLLHKVREC